MSDYGQGMRLTLFYLSKYPEKSQFFIILRACQSVNPKLMTVRFASKLALTKDRQTDRDKETKEYAETIKKVPCRTSELQRGIYGSYSYIIGNTNVVSLKVESIMPLYFEPPTIFSNVCQINKLLSTIGTNYKKKVTIR